MTQHTPFPLLHCSPFVVLKLTLEFSVARQKTYPTTTSPRLPNSHHKLRPPLISPNISTMPRAPKRRPLTGCHHRKPKRQAKANERWLHLSSCQVGQMRTLQTVMSTTSLFCMSLYQLRAHILAAETVVTAHADLAVLHAAFDSVSITLVTFLGLLRAAAGGGPAQRGRSGTLPPSPRRPRRPENCPPPCRCRRGGCPAQSPLGGSPSSEKDPRVALHPPPKARRRRHRHRRRRRRRCLSSSSSPSPPPSPSLAILPRVGRIVVAITAAVTDAVVVVIVGVVVVVVVGGGGRRLRRWRCVSSSPPR